MAERDDSGEISLALAALLELEEDIAARIARARESSARAVERARAAAEHASAHRDDERHEAFLSLREELGETHRAELAAIEKRVRTECDRLDFLDDETIAALADALVEELMTLVVPEEPTR